MGILGIVTAVAEIVVGSGVGTVVGNVIKTTTPKNLSKFQKLGVMVGSAAITGVLGDLCVDYIENKIGETVEMVEAGKQIAETVKNIKENMEEEAND